MTPQHVDAAGPHGSDGSDPAPLGRSTFAEVTASDYRHPVVAAATETSGPCGEMPRAAERPTSHRPGSTTWTADDDLTDAQLRALDRLWHAQREGVGDEAAAEVAGLVRAGRVTLAYRRLGAARRSVAARRDSTSRGSD